MAKLTKVTGTRFKVEAGTAGVLRVAEVLGLNILVEEIDMRVSTTEAVRKTSGRPSYGNVILRRPFKASDASFYDLIVHTIQREPNQTKHNFTISLLNSRRQPIVTWHLYGAFPVRHSSPVLNANANEMLIEELELAVEGIELIRP
jgi:phage tail-like protein